MPFVCPDCVFNRDRSHSPDEWMDLDEQDGCIFPHLEWQGVHGCDSCCIQSTSVAE